MTSAFATVLHKIFPLMVRASSEVEIGPECMASYFKVFLGLRKLKGWAVRRECPSVYMQLTFFVPSFIIRGFANEHVGCHAPNLVITRDGRYSLGYQVPLYMVVPHLCRTSWFCNGEQKASRHVTKINGDCSAPPPPIRRLLPGTNNNDHNSD
ncbi:hypothetical protein HPB48_003606 [Haemaphysalis longicornis]|uniref:Uncharacterized protein n=1 Tax=Haemaphysalis longicornis TaxID=44386 RepID=A0A9J6FDL4_HAELO|nr:hypothetical protein HPB48_003606 [Haemaphysalis longicornis]